MGDFISTLAHPGGIIPVVGKITKRRGGAWGKFHGECKGIRFRDLVAAMVGDNMKLIKIPSFQIGDEACPYAGITNKMKKVPARFPIVKIPDNTDRLGGRRPNRKVKSMVVVKFEGVSPKLFIKPAMVPFIE